MTKLRIYNSIAREKQEFEPINPPLVGLYVCGPTVYGDAHLGHARPAVTFDVVFRYLRHLGYKVRYVRNITDVGHLENDAEVGEDKIAKKARIEQLEPMEVVQHYTLGYHRNMAALRCRPPSVEPRASGHIIEQIDMVQKILDNGLAYEVDGSVYFDVMKYAETNHYGKLSGRVLEDLQSETRKLAGQDVKKNSADFALWKKAEPEHIMRWPSPWSDGFPGWHLECSVMSTKYLGDTFDIHGGGMDLLFPHHECEIAQSKGAYNQESVKYWMHNNMITINGQKMGKSLGNFITLDEFFSGNHDSLERAYSPMTIRFFMLQAHYRSTLDFSNEALQAAEKGHQRLMNALKTLDQLEFKGSDAAFDPEKNQAVQDLCAACHEHLNDDFNTALVLADLFELATNVNSWKNGVTEITSIAEETFELVKKTMTEFITEIFGLTDEQTDGDNGALDGVMQLIIDIRAEARANKDWGTSDKIRDDLKALKIQIKDEKDGGASWSVK